ncbi:MAG: TraB/GumN family protein [Prevotellaceae bacterium]|jgi:uncharacterized protein YbaP (TraB family)|nr:TraB/GumN family protein [Prevotellaceae bacterium]
MKRSLFLLLLTTITLTAQAQLLWKITKKGYEKPSYLFGTHHLIDNSFLEKVPGLFPAFRSTNIVVGEIVLNKVDVLEEVQRAMKMPDNQRISQLLTPAQFHLVDSVFLAVLKVSLQQVDFVRPVLLSSMYEAALFEQSSGRSSNTPSDSFFQQIAEEQGKKVLGLETAAEQLQMLFAADSLAKQAEDLYRTVAQGDSVLDMMRQITALYEKGDLDALYRLSSTGGDMEMTEAEQQNYLVKRNRNWAKQLEEYFSAEGKQAAFFVAVGALHLPGENGLVQLLRKKGFRVKAVL